MANATPIDGDLWLMSGTSILKLRPEILSSLPTSEFFGVIFGYGTDMYFWNGEEAVSMSGFKSSALVADDSVNGIYSVLNGLVSGTYQFRSIKKGSSKVSITKDANNNIVIDLGSVGITDIIGLQTALANKSDVGHNHNNLYYTKTEIDNKVGSVYRVKGTKATYGDLPSTGNVAGDVWNVTAVYQNYPAGTNFVWNGTEWDALGGTIDLSVYALSSQTLVAATPTSTQVGAGAKAINAILQWFADNISFLLDKYNSSLKEPKEIAITGTGGTITAATHGFSKVVNIQYKVGGVYGILPIEIGSSNEIVWTSKTNLQAGDSAFIIITGK